MRRRGGTGEHFLEVAGAADDGYEKGGAAVLEGLAWFDLEWGNIRAAQAWAVAHTERDDGAARVACDLPLRAVHCLSLRQSPHEQIRWSDAGLVAARRLGWRQGEGRHLGNLGNAYAKLRDAHKAIEYYDQYLAIARETGDRKGEGNALGSMGIAYHALGDVRKAIECYEQQLTIARETGDRNGEANACWNLGLEYEALDDLSRAIELMQLCVDFERAVGHPDADKHEARVNELRARLAAQQAGGGTPPDEV